MLDARGTVLVAREDDRLLGCVHIEPAEPDCWIGMLATLPSRQAQGLGKRLLAAAEDLAVSRYGAQGFRMSVLSSRPELLAYYERRGYRLTGSADAYPVDAGVGRPLDAGLRVLELFKAHRAPTREG